MKTLIIFNSITNVIIIGYYLCLKNPFYIEVNRTFWCKKPYSITLWRYTYRSENGSSANGLFTIPIRNYQKAMEWDDKMFRSGEYKKYDK